MMLVLLPSVNSEDVKMVLIIHDNYAMCVLIQAKQELLNETVENVQKHRLEQNRQSTQRLVRTRTCTCLLVLPIP